MRTLAFVLGAGHSGTTLLSLLLDAHPDVVSVGELQAWAVWDRMPRFKEESPDDLRCTCGEPFATCAFWSRVQDSVRSRVGEPDLELGDWPVMVFDPRDYHRTRPRLRDALQLIGSPRLWRLAGGVSSDVSEQRRTTERSFAIYEAACAAAGASVVVDTGKTPGTGKNRYLHSPDRVRFIHLVRDGRAVAASYVRREGWTLEEASRRWRARNLKVAATLASVPRSRRLRVRYEDLCARPEQALQRIGRFLDLREPMPEPRLGGAVAHNIGGNPMRFREHRDGVQLDDRWRGELDGLQLATFDRVAGRLNHRLGYR